MVDTREHLVVCTGASIVRGLFGTNFVELLSRRMGKEGFRFINAGAGGDLAYDLLMRLDTVLTCQPDFVVILIGTNDVTAALYPKIAQGSLRRLKRKLPQKPSANWYKEIMLNIVRQMKEKTRARIGLASLPVLGEDLMSLPNERITAYNALLREITVQEQVSYLPVHEHQIEYLKSVQHTAGRRFEVKEMLTLSLIIRHYLSRQSFDQISEKNGFLLVTDGMHMNSTGAGIIADEVESFLRASM